MHSDAYRRSHVVVQTARVRFDARGGGRNSLANHPALAERLKNELRVSAHDPRRLTARLRAPESGRRGNPGLSDDDHASLRPRPTRGEITRRDRLGGLLHEFELGDPGRRQSCSNLERCTASRWTTYTVQS